jgi:hypothetical protein
MRTPQLADDRRFRISIASIVTAALLVGSVQCIVIALEEPLRLAVIWLINLAIAAGHLRVLSFFDHAVFWPVVVLNLLNAAVGLCLTYWLARRNFNKGNKTQNS